ncbi:MAG: Aspartyl/glutamyl-tRNA(Asn/Gln) amidotransferase subunit B [Candidatus Heimdallarchaeota archaeon LC_3]|nr:MAG: Aspartyl/glutamyl-tRNA(Asn/Gln) amidotransferase subunit B [Candidatus Heimdallarchaeota archaeon LC_3]
MSISLKVKVGLEVHCQLNFLSSKLFCSCSINSQDAAVNENSCPVCRGLPGSLPDLNGDAIKKGLMLGKALKMTQVKELYFSRKHYFYPDLPKSFQITQTDGVIGKEGILPVKTSLIPIKQIQLEEDPAKINYTEEGKIIDYNRSGTPLIELVTDPVFTNESEIKSFLKQYRRLLELLKISDTKKESAFRVDLNISVGKHPRVEVKNIGSDTEIINAFLYESKRQINEHNEQDILIETRHWDPKLQISIKSREKESAIDYMYIPEFDIPRIQLPNSFSQELVLPELPWEAEERISKLYELSNNEIQMLLDDKTLLNFYEKLISYFSQEKKIMSQIFWREFLEWYNSNNNEYIGRLLNIPLIELKTFLEALQNDKISFNLFKKSLKKYITKNDFLKLPESENMEIFSNEKIFSKLQEKFPEIWIKSFENPNLLNYLVGQGVKLAKGKINPKKLLVILKERKK